MLKIAPLLLCVLLLGLGSTSCTKKKTAAQANAEREKLDKEKSRTRAIKYYKDLVTNYPDSELAAKARQRLQVLEPDPAAGETDGAEVTKTERLRALIPALRQTYPDAHCELDHANALQLLIATILSAQCTDKRVNLVTPLLFQRCPTARDLAAIPGGELEAIIQSTGFFRAKAKSIRACAQALVEKHGGEVPAEMASLTELAGVGRKTANVVLGNAFGINEGVVVDTHVHRLSQRLGLTKQDDAIKIEQDLMKIVPREDWAIFSHWLIFHGRRRCFARKPDCSQCEVQTLCPCAFRAGGGAKGTPTLKPKVKDAAGKPTLTASVPKGKRGRFSAPLLPAP